jgi:hypothetical protein
MAQVMEPKILNPGQRASVLEGSSYIVEGLSLLPDLRYADEQVICSFVPGVSVSIYFFNRLEKRKLKIETARKLFGNRYDIKSQAFKESLNEIMLVFSDCDEVISAMEEFWNTLQTPITSRPPNAADDNLTKLMKIICREIGIENIKLNDSFYLRVFGN